MYWRGLTCTACRYKHQENIKTGVPKRHDLQKRWNDCSGGDSHLVCADAPVLHPRLDAEHGSAVQHKRDLECRVLEDAHLWGRFQEDFVTKTRECID